MQLQIDLPETLALQFLPHLDQSPEIIEAGLQQVSQQDAPTAFQISASQPDYIPISYSSEAQVPGNFLDFLGDLEQRRRLIRKVLNEA